MALTRRGDSSVAVLDPGTAIGTIQVGEQLITARASLFKTIEEARRALKFRNIVLCYRKVTNDQRNAFSSYRATEVVLGYVQNKWYEVSGQDIPAKVMSNQQERIRMATDETVVETETQGEATAEGGKTKGKGKKSGEPRVTIKSIIENGLAAGTPDQEILAEVKAKFPDAKADEKHVNYYRHFMIKDKRLPESAKPPRVKKEKAAAAETSAEGGETPATDVAAVEGAQTEGAGKKRRVRQEADASA